MKINKKLILNIIVTLIIGSLPSIFVFKGMNDYGALNKPPLSPPGFIFPIVWGILYILMGISYTKVTNKKSLYTDEAKLIYGIQLVVNALWTPIFFGLKQYFLAFIWLLMLIVLVVFMIIIFNKIDKKAAYLQIPYILWLLFAAYLNFGVFILN